MLRSWEAWMALTASRYFSSFSRETHAWFLESKIPDCTPSYCRPRSLQLSVFLAGLEYSEWKMLNFQTSPWLGWTKGKVVSKWASIFFEAKKWDSIKRWKIWYIDFPRPEFLSNFSKFPVTNSRRAVTSNTSGREPERFSTTLLFLEDNQWKP